MLPGLAAISTSQRAASSFALYNSGSLSPRWLLLTLVPDLLGGSGSFGQPAFFATYQLAEVTSYIGILPLVAALALLARVRLRRPAPEWLVWHLVALVGIVLALGGSTPLGHLLAHLPLLGSQRLQSRNILVADTALAVLLAYWADDPLGPVSRATAGIRHRWRRWWTNPATMLALLPPVAVAVVAAIGIWWPGGTAGLARGERQRRSRGGQPGVLGRAVRPSGGRRDRPRCTRQAHVAAAAHPAHRRIRASRRDHIHAAGRCSGTSRCRSQHSCGIECRPRNPARTRELLADQAHRGARLSRPVRDL